MLIAIARQSKRYLASLAYEQSLLKSRQIYELRLRKGKRLRILLLLKSKYLQKLNSNSLGKRLPNPQL
jgi:hypothetical protein